MLQENILIIDDSETDYKIMKTILLQANPNYKITHNLDGRGIIDTIIKESIDVVILDLLIDTIDGVDILQEIKLGKTTTNIPVIICSSIGEKEMIKRTLSLGAHDYFEKPLSDMALEFGFELKVRNALISKQRADRVNFLKNHDELTGLWTRKYFELKLQSLVNSKSLPIGVIILDINGLKVINDAYGHDYGDKILMDMGRILNESSNKFTIAARWGSDEMVVLVHHADKRLIDIVITSLEQRLSMGGKKEYDISFGWAIETSNLENVKYLVQRAEDNLYSNKILEPSSIRSNMINTILKTLHQKNPREEMHSHRVSAISEQIAMKLGFSKYEIKKVTMAGLLHDIGKISIDEKILNKPGKLDQEEWEFIKKHPEHGFKILSTSLDTMEIAKAILAHHEKWDGSGYPKGLKGTDIPIMSRIISVADTFDAMTSIRSYKPAISHKEAIEEIISCKDTHFDPIVVEAFLEYYQESKENKRRKAI